MDKSILNEYQSALEAALGAIAAHSLITSKESSRVIRDCSKKIQSISVDLRKELLEIEKSLTTKES